MTGKHFPPTFIGGCGRSGTTMIVDSLGNHPDISPVYETDFVLQLLQARATGQFNPTRFVQFMDNWSRPLPHRPHSKKEYEHYHHGPHYFLPTREEVLAATQHFVGYVEEQSDFDSAVRQFVEGLFARHAELDRKPYWLNKTPLYVIGLPALHQFFPEMRFLHVIRNADDTARSIVGRPWGPNTHREAVAYHQRHVAAGRTWGASYPDRYYEIEYEALLRDARSVLEDGLNWLGVSVADYPFDTLHVRAS